MRKLATLTAAAAMAAAFGFAAGDALAHHDKGSHTTSAGGFRGVFEAPMMDSIGEIVGSEGKIGDAGEYKLEIEPVTDDTTYKICLRFATVLGVAGSDVFVDDVTLGLLDTELKAEGNLITLGVLTDPDDVYRPAFRVYTGGDSDTCNGTIEFESGLTVT